MINEALGVVETRSLVSAVKAADTMLKTANVSLMAVDFIGSGVVAISVEGDVAAVKAAVLAGSEDAKLIGEVISANVIPRPHSEVNKLY
ncbi:BMC domain-containing protein [Neofamilia massiliensis]|uniref:BMC domain-containing protein n=1 Tax=Neofamilia massiliensis TaxID=1673724 RepID=UPI0006BB7E41|nr:BMC domain-containing protein [Neofamilia massiliensis]